MEKRNDNVISIGQTGGQTAHTIINHYQPPQRSITDETAQVMVSKLMPFTGKRFRISVSNNDLEGIKIAKRLKEILVDSGWIEVEFSYNLAGTYPPGIHIQVSKDPTEPDQILANSMLQLTNFKNIYTSKNQKVEDLSIFIGPNPE